MRFLKWLLMLLEAWQRRRDEKAAEANRARASINQSIRTADAAAKIDKASAKSTTERTRKATKRAKDLGVCLLLSFALAGPLHAQDAEDRIANYTHDELKIYTQAVVDLAREQKSIIEDLQKQNTDLTARLETVNASLAEVQKSLEKLDVATKPGVISRFISWTLRLAPIVIAVAN